MGDLRMSRRMLKSSGSSQFRTRRRDLRGGIVRSGVVVSLALLSGAVLVGLLARPGAAVNVPQAAVVSANPEDWTPHVLDGKVESLAVAPDGLHVFAGGSFTKVDGVAQKSLVKLRLSDGARITAFKGRTNARVKDMAVSGGRLYIGGTFKIVNAVARTALAAVDPVTGALSADLNLAFTGSRPVLSTSTSSTSPRRLKAHRHRHLDLGGRPAARPRSWCSTWPPARSPSPAGRPPATSSSAPRCSPPPCVTSTSGPTAATSWS
jgi:hypothetical protein